MSNVNTNANAEQQIKLPAGAGQIPAELKGKLNVSDPMQAIPTVVPNKEGFMKGTTLAGYYLRTDRVYSEKFTAGKREAGTGRKYRDLHVFKDAKNIIFGIWSVGTLGFALKKVQPNTFIAITYLGVADKALRQGESPAHMFKYEGVNLDLSGRAIDSDDKDEEINE